MYFFANWKESVGHEGAAPELPKNVDSYGIVWSADMCPWVILDSIELDEDYTSTKGVEGVSDDLTILLDSARAYPPALVLAVKELQKETDFNKADIDRKFCDLLRGNLQKQEADAYILVEATVEDEGYLAEGEFVWAISYLSETNEISWISADHNIYTNPADDFKLTDQQKSKLETG